MIWFVDIGLVKIKIGQIGVMNIKTSILGKETKGTSILCLIWGGSCYVHPTLLLGHPANSEVAKLPFSNSSSGR